MRTDERPGSGLRVVHLATIPFVLGYLAGHLKAQAEAGLQVHVICSPGLDLDRFCSETGAVPHPVEIPRPIEPVGDLRALLRVVRELRRIAPDVVHAHMPKAGLIGMVGARLAGISTRIYHCHGLRYETATGFKRRLLKQAERTSCSNASLVLTVSHSARRLMIAEGLVPPEKLQVPLGGSIGGVDSERRFRPATRPERESARRGLGIPLDSRVIGFVGRLTRDKGLVELFYAWRALRERLPDLHWLVVGPVEDGDPVPAPVIAAMQADHRVHMTGLDWETPRLFRAMDVLALPSYREGFPVVLLEAAATGLAIVATRATGCVDAVVDGATGTLVDVGDAAQLEQALARYLEDAKLREAHGGAARQRVQSDFRPEQLHEAVQEIYRREIEKGRRPA